MNYQARSDIRVGIANCHKLRAHGHRADVVRARGIFGMPRVGHWMKNARIPDSKHRIRPTVFVANEASGVCKPREYSWCTRTCDSAQRRKRIGIAQSIRRQSERYYSCRITGKVDRAAFDSKVFEYVLAKPQHMSISRCTGFGPTHCYTANALSANFACFIMANHDSQTCQDSTGPSEDGRESAVSTTNA